MSRRWTTCTAGRGSRTARWRGPAHRAAAYDPCDGGGMGPPGRALRDGAGEGRERRSIPSTTTTRCGSPTRDATWSDHVVGVYAWHSLSFDAAEHPAVLEPGADEAGVRLELEAGTAREWDAATGAASARGGARWPCCEVGRGAQCTALTGGDIGAFKDPLRPEMRAAWIDRYAHGAWSEAHRLGDVGL